MNKTIADSFITARFLNEMPHYSWRRWSPQWEFALLANCTFHRLIDSFNTTNLALKLPLDHYEKSTQIHSFMLFLTRPKSIERSAKIHPHPLETYSSKNQSQLIGWINWMIVLVTSNPLLQRKPYNHNSHISCYASIRNTTWKRIISPSTRNMWYRTVALSKKTYVNGKQSP